MPIHDEAGMQQAALDGDPAAAAEHFRKLCERTPDDPQILNLHGVALAKLGRAALEAALRRAAQPRGPSGTLEPQPIGIVRELHASGHLTREEFNFLEQIRRLRNDSVRGLATPAIQAPVVQRVIQFTRRILGERAPTHSAPG